MPKNSPHAGALDLAKSGKKVKVSILQNVYAETLVHAAMPQAEVMQFDSVANAVLALDSGRVDAAAIDDSTVRWLARQSPDKYKSGNYGWSPQTYAAAVRPGDPVWLNFVNTVLHEAMTGVEFDAYAAGFEKFFGVKLAPPPVGFPSSSASATNSLRQSHRRGAEDAEEKHEREKTAEDNGLCWINALRTYVAS